MAMTRTANATWSGDLPTGSGTVGVASGVFDGLATSWRARTEAAEGKTSPEELLAAAHASCFSMALSHVLNQAGTPPDQLSVSVDVTFVPGEGITTSEIDVTGAVPGVSQEAFAKAAEDAKDNCPVSSELQGNVDLKVNARLAS